MIALVILMVKVLEVLFEMFCGLLFRVAMVHMMSLPFLGVGGGGTAITLWEGR